MQTIASSIGMPDYVLDAVRSVDGVKYAVPLYSGTALVKLRIRIDYEAGIVGYLQILVAHQQFHQARIAW